MAYANLSLLERVKFHLENGADVHYFDSSGIVFVLRVAHPDGKLPHLSVLDYLLERDDVTRIEKIDALEMAGAVLLAHDGNHEKFPLAFQYWRRALTLRLMDTEDCRPIYKTPLKSKRGQLSEWSTLDDIQRIEQQPAKRKIQSLLVRLRIFSRIGWSAVNQHFLPSIIDFLLMVQPQEGSMSEILDLSWITLNTILRSDHPHESNVQASVLDFVTRVIFYFKRLLRFPPQNDSNYSDRMKEFIDLVLMMDPPQLVNHNLKTQDAELRYMINLCLMLSVLSKDPALIINEEIRLSLLQLVHRDVRDRYGCNLLHICCRLVSDGYLSTIAFLVQLGADLNAGNNVGDGVLHILIKEGEREIRDDAKGLLLVKLGAHLDMVNKDGMTAADLWFRKNKRERRDIVHLPDWLQEDVPSLMCLSSRVIRRHRLPYDDGAIVPAMLIPFVSLH